MKLTRFFALALASAVYLAAPTSASANTLSLDAVLIPHAFQQTTNRPCVIGEPSCTFVTPVAPTTNAIFAPNGPNPDQDVTSADFLVSTIRALFGGTGDNFVVGVDVNQDDAAQTLVAFYMLVNDVVIDTYTGPTSVPPTVGGGNGNGYADYLLTNFTSLVGFDDDDIVTFRAVMTGLSDGREQFFLIESNPVPCTVDCEPPVVPEPGTLLMFGSGLALLAARLRRRKA